MDVRRTLPKLGLVVAAVAAALWWGRSREADAPTSSPAASDSVQPTAPKLGLPPVVVAVFDDGAPKVGRWVVFHDASGAVLSSSKSDAKGEASGEVPEGGMITVAYGTSIRHLVTVTGVRPGERIVVGEAEDEGEAGRSVASARLKLPGPREGASRYTVSLGVGGAELTDPARTLSLPVLRRFAFDEHDPADASVAGRRFRVLGEAFAPSGEPIAFAFAWGELSRVDAGAVDVQLPAWSAAYRPHAFVLADPPAGLRTVTARLGVVTGRGQRFERPPRSADLDGSTTIRFPLPEPLGDDVELRLEASWDGAADRSVLARRMQKSTQARIDLATELLPRVSAAAVERSDDLARPLVRWTVAGDASKADAAVLRIKWPSSGEHVWTVVAPPATPPGLKLPALPPALAAWRPDERPAAAAAALVESSEYAGYDDVRRKGIEAAAEPLGEDLDGSLRWSATGDIAF